MIQTFTTTTTACVFPVVLCSVLTFLMVLTSYDWWRFFLVTVITLVLNQTWIAVYMMIIYANPSNACHATLMVAILAGFASGFVVTQEQMPIGLVSSVLKLVISSQGRIPRRWEERPWEREWERGCLNGHRQFVFVFFFCRFNLLFYINPQLYGFSAITKVLLRNVHLKCEFESALNCISKDGNAVLAKFEFDSVNPFEYMMVSGPFFYRATGNHGCHVQFCQIMLAYTTVVIDDLLCCMSRLVTSSLACCTFPSQYVTQHYFCCKRYFFLLTHSYILYMVFKNHS